MSSPTEAEVQTQIKNAVAYYVAVRGWGGTDTPNLISLEDTLIQSLEGDYTSEVLQALRGIRAGFGGLIAYFRSVLDPLWLAYGKVRGFPEEVPEIVIARLYDYMIANAKSVNSREFTFGSVAAGGSNVGTGTIYRLTKDENNLDLEAVTPDVKTITCIQDAATGATEQQERFEIRGEQRDRDGILVTGSGRQDIIRAVSAADSASYLQNPSFDTLDGTAGSLTSIPGWTPTTSLANFTLSTSTYRGYPGSPSTPYSLKLGASDSVYQPLSNLRVTIPSIGGVLAPMFLQVAWNREVGSGDGTITLTLGDQTASVAMAAQTGWNLLNIAVGQKLWYDVWRTTAPQVKIALASWSTGYVLFDDVVFAPMVPFDGAWYLPVGGATPFLRDDVFTFTDTIASDAKIQRAIAEIYGMYLPHNAAVGETWTDPA